MSEDIGREYATLSLSNHFAHLDLVRPTTQMIIARTKPAVLNFINTHGIGPISSLAIDAIGSGDPEVILSMYRNGTGLSDETLMDLSTAVARASRRGTDSLDEYNKIVALKQP